MLERIINSFFEYFTNRKVLFFILLSTIIAGLLVGVQKLKIDQNIYSILPQGQKFHSLNKLISQNDVAKKVFFQLEIDKLEEDEKYDLLDKINDEIISAGKELIQKPVIYKEDLQDEIYQYYYNNFPSIIDDNYYKKIDEKTYRDSIKKSVKNTYKSITSPSGDFIKKYVLNDPLFISTDFFKELQESNSESNINIEDDLMITKDGQSIFFYTSINTTNIEENEQLYHSLKKVKSDWNSLYPQNEIDFFGSFEIAVENSIQVKKDSIITSSITIALILFILFAFYRKLLTPIYFILPAIFGGLFSCGIVGFIHPNISGLALATSAVLFGIVLDYSFHFFTHYAHTKSLKETIKDITSPLLTGSLTTILAFAILMFANSTILKDFGLVATLTLIGASLFTLLILPVIIALTGFKADNISGKGSLVIKFPELPKKLYPIGLLLVIITTIGLFLASNDVAFDSDLSNLSYHQESLKDKEDKFIGINPETETKLYLFSNGTSLEGAKEVNYVLINKLNSSKSDSLLTEYYSTGDFLIPEGLKQKRISKWNSYWSKNADSAFKQLDKSSIKYGFNESAFSKFKTWTSNYNSIKNKSKENSLLKQLELSNLINQSENGSYSILSTVIVSKNHKNELKNRLLQINNVEIFDRADMASSLVNMVKDDFNYLLYGSTIIVFVILLIIYGRIELTLLSFVPMIIGWIWILGFASLFDIKFNFANILIATFIFGLGDDFSIFITDGLLSKYKYKKDNIDSYKQAIFLSAITTILGTGVLFFAKHPAIHSIALISVLGISCILLISLIIQPILFNFFVQNRIEKRKPPVTFFALIGSSILFSIFVLGCISALIPLLVLIILPLNKVFKQKIMNFTLSKLAWLMMYSGPHLKKQTLNKEFFDFKNPSIIIANHTSFLDILLVILMNPKVVIVVKEWVYNSPIFGILIRFAGYLFAGDGPEQNFEKAKELIKNGYSIVVFPEGSRSQDGELKRFHKGAFFLAQELKADITPIILHGCTDVLAKNQFMINQGTITTKVLPRIKHSDISWGETYKERTKSISKYYKQEFKKAKDELETVDYLKPVIFRNYVYKGPLLEWYFKIKWEFEKKNYQFYNNLIDTRTNILDIGCGYGYLSYYLHYKNKSRTILGLDYDNEKIEIAKHAFDITSNVGFQHQDITKYDFPSTDVIFFNDVLHYLSEEEQTEVLKRSYSALMPNGIIVIRDGITNLDGRHQKTLKTEKYSTSILGFNKKDRVFNFFSSEFVSDFAEKNNLKYEMLEQSKKTSNVLFILRKD